VLKRLKQQFAADEQARDDWYRHWIAVGFEALEATLARDAQTGRFCHGDSPTLADVCLVPQLFNARRFKSPLEAYPTILRIHEACMALDAFRRAAPESQPDAE
jgi:maleylacetoacetate isomerase